MPIIHVTSNIDDDSHTTDIIIPSQVADNIFDCLKGKGLHFIHINARSMFHKLPELQYIASLTNPAIISISETWLDDTFTDDSIKIVGYNVI